MSLEVECQKAPMIQEDQQLFEIAAQHGLPISLKTLEHPSGRYGYIVTPENRPPPWKPRVLVMDFDNSLGGTRAADLNTIHTDLEQLTRSLGCSPGDAHLAWQKVKEASYVEEIPGMPWLFNHHRHSVGLSKTIAEMVSASPETTATILEKVINIMQSNIARIPYYPDIPEVLKRIASEADVSLVICTRGYSIAQWKKTARWLEQHPDVPISAVCLSNVPKGPFLHHWFQELQRTNPRLAADVHNIVMWDDSALEVGTVADAARNSSEQQAHLSAIRVLWNDTPDRDTPTPSGIPTFDGGDPYTVNPERVERMYHYVMTQLRQEKLSE